ncbi:hypothetical protein HMPREF9554_03152 [Treponema phagedenis F0421]|nr:hypothetical protein HMPREF9554_03152 [Treponema phagedenis F0421]
MHIQSLKNENRIRIKTPGLKNYCLSASTHTRRFLTRTISCGLPYTNTKKRLLQGNIKKDFDTQ